MALPVLRHKHMRLDQRKIDFARRYFGVQTDQEAVDRALSLLLDEKRIVDRLKPLAGILSGDDPEWPYV